MSKLPFNGQIFKQRNRVAGDTGNSTFDEISDEKIEIPEIGGVIDQIDNQLNKSIEIVVSPKEFRTMDDDGCVC